MPYALVRIKTASANKTESVDKWYKYGSIDRRFYLAVAKIKTIIALE